MTFSCCALVPSRNHYLAVPQIVAALRRNGLAVLLIDDGSDEPARSHLAKLHAPEDRIEVLRLEPNRGKGGAMVEGFRRAVAQGYSHALQIDADGQHDLNAVPQLIDLARRYPAALIAARPLYDGSVPTARRVGRWLTHFWVYVETLSLRIADSMCGLRVYPLAAVGALIDSEPVGRGMDFDTDIMVRLFWRGVPPLQPPVRVTYPEGNVSNFRLLRDNLRISAMHTRLVLGMIWRLPVLLFRRPPTIVDSTQDRASHWSTLQERGAYLGLRLLLLAWKLLGRRGCLALAAPAVAYFYLTGTEQRRASQNFLHRVAQFAGRSRPSAADSWRHYMSFAGRGLDSLMAWTGAIDMRQIAIADPARLQEIESDPRGCILIVSHHGNVDVSRAALDPAMRRRLMVLVHTRHAVNYNRILREANPAAAIDLLQVSEIGPDTAVMLQQQIDAGRWLVIAGDRPPISGERHVARVAFLGAPAPFALGPFLLASIMRCPVNLLFCRRAGEGFVMRIERFAERIELPRGRRHEALAAYAARYAEILQIEARDAPLQWYNFFDFWADS